VSRRIERSRSSVTLKDTSEIGVAAVNAPQAGPLNVHSSPPERFA
jgi:hypothetical protein